MVQLLSGVKSPALEELVEGQLRGGRKENVLRLRTAYSQMQDRLNLIYDMDLNKLERVLPSLPSFLLCSHHRSFHCRTSLRGCGRSWRRRRASSA